MYFKDATARTIVLDTREGLGTITSVQDSNRHGKVITVMFGRPLVSSYQKSYDVRGILLDSGFGNGQQQLFYADDKEAVEMQARLRKVAPTYERTMFDEMSLGRKVFDPMLGWGEVIALEPDTRLINVEFLVIDSTVSSVIPAKIQKRMTYTRFGESYTRPSLGKRLFTADEIKEGKLTSVMNSRLKGDECPNPVRFDKHSLRYVLESNESKPETKSYIFFYKPKGTRGFLQNVMIGVGTGKNIRDALENLYREDYGPNTRGDCFDRMARESGLFERIFAYECSNVSSEEKETLANIERHVKDHRTGSLNKRLLLAAVTATRP